MPADPAPRQARDPNAVYLISGKTLATLEAAANLTGHDGQIKVSRRNGKLNVEFASEQPCYIIQNGARVLVGIPIRNL